MNHSSLATFLLVVIGMMQCSTAHNEDAPALNQVAALRQRRQIIEVEAPHNDQIPKDHQSMYADIEVRPIRKRNTVVREVSLNVEKQTAPHDSPNNLNMEFGSGWKIDRLLEDMFLFDMSFSMSFSMSMSMP